MVIFVGTEVMFFAGLISAFTISKAGAPRDAWNLPAGEMLPLAATDTNQVHHVAFPGRGPEAG